MADNTTINPGASGDVIATDEVTTLNGAGSAGVKVQRQKVCYGDDGEARDVSTSFPMPVVAPTLTKGTQSSTGFSVQELKDAGRTSFSACSPVAGTTAVASEALLTLDQQKALASTGASNQITATSGKRLRIHAITVGLRASGAAVLAGTFALRGVPSGSVTTASPALHIIPCSSGPATANQGNELTIPLPEAIEISGTQALGITQVCSGTGGVVWASLVGYEY